MRTGKGLWAAAVLLGALGCGGSSGGEDETPVVPGPALPTGTVPSGGSASALGGHAVIGGVLAPAERPISSTFRIENGGIRP